MLSSCEKDNSNDSKSLTGKWIKSTNYDEYIDFIDDKNVLINRYDFDYEIHSDSIYFQYVGELEILCLESAHKIQIDYVNQILKIENINKLCLVYGDTGYTVYSKKIQPNDFIGKWITADLIDTLCFVTNERLERPRGYFNDWYEYSFTNDSLTIQYKGPDKIYVFPITTKYSLVNDSLIINFNKDYYPNIVKGLKKYLKS
jgi:hypothetical protein